MKSTREDLRVLGIYEGGCSNFLCRAPAALVATGILRYMLQVEIWMKST